MAELSEIEAAVKIFRNEDIPLMLLHCVSAYPTPLEECNLAMINVLKKQFDLPVGYSGHELGYLPTIVAVSMGAVAIERHYTLDKSMTGFDHKMSLEPDELIAMIESIRNIEKIQGTGEKHVSETEWVTRRKYHVSMVSIKEIPEGAVLRKQMITYRNPGTGIPAKEASNVFGKKAVHYIQADKLLSLGMFE